jgi:hypothetical protein
MFDRFMYKLLGSIDDLFSAIETYSVKFTSWLWSKRVILLRKRRKNATRRTNRNK